MLSKCARTGAGAVVRSRFILRSVSVSRPKSTTSKKASAPLNDYRRYADERAAVLRDRRDEGPATEQSAAEALPSRSGFEWRMELLQRQMQRRGWIDRASLERAVDALHCELASSRISSTNSLALLQYCGALLPEVPVKERTKIAERVCSSLAKFGVDFDVGHYNAILSTYLDNAVKFATSDFLDMLRAKRVKPNRVTLELLLAKHCSDGHMQMATETIGQLKDMGASPSESATNTLVYGHTKAGDEQQAREVFASAAAALPCVYRVTAATYGAMARAHAERRDRTRMEAVISEATAGGCPLLDDQVHSVTFALANAGQPIDIVSTVLSRAPREEGYASRALGLAYRLVAASKLEAAIAVARAYKPPNAVSVDAGPGAGVCRLLVRRGEPLDLLKSVAERMRAENIYERPLTAMVEAAYETAHQGRDQLWEEQLVSCELLDLPTRVNIYMPKLIGAFKRADAADFAGVVGRMQKNGVDLADQRFWCHLFDAVGATCGNLGFLRALVYECDKLGVEPADKDHIFGGFVPSVIRRGQLAGLGKVLDAFPTSRLNLYRPITYVGMLAEQLVDGSAESQRAMLDVMQRTWNVEWQRVEDGGCAAVNFPFFGAVDWTGQIVQAAVERIVYSSSGSLDDKGERVQQLLAAVGDKDLFISEGRVVKVESLLGAEWAGRLFTLLHGISAELQLENWRGSGDRPPSFIERVMKMDESEQQAEVERLMSGNYASHVKLGLCMTIYALHHRVHEAVHHFNEYREAVKLLDMASLSEEHRRIVANNYKRVIRLTLRHREFNMAKTCYDELRRLLPDTLFPLMPAHAIYMATTMVEQGAVEEAFAVLGNASPYPKSLGDAPSPMQARSERFTVGAARHLVEAAVERQKYGVAERLVHCLVDNNLVHAASGPECALAIIEGLVERDDLAGGVKLFCRMCDRYDNVGGHRPLMAKAVEKRDKLRLTTVFNVAVKLRSERFAMIGLTEALLTLGEVAKAAQVFDDSFIVLGDKEVANACRRAIAAEQPSVLEGYVQLMRRVQSAAANPSAVHLFTGALLELYERSGDWKAALAVWAESQASKEKMSESNVAYLVEILEKFGQKLPAKNSAIVKEAAKAITKEEPKTLRERFQVRFRDALSMLLAPPPLEISKLTDKLTDIDFSIRAKIERVSMHKSKKGIDYARLIFADESGCIRGAYFNPSVRHLEYLQEGNVIDLTAERKVVRPSNPHFNWLAHDFEMFLHQGVLMRLSHDQSLTSAPITQRPVNRNLVYPSVNVADLPSGGDNPWRLNVRLLDATPLEEMKGHRDRFRCSFVFGDASGAVHAAAFHPEAVRLYDRLVVGHAYEIDGVKGDLFDATGEYSSLPCSHRMTLINDMIKLAEDQTLESVTVPYTFTPLADVLQLTEKEPATRSDAVDLLGVVKRVGKLKSTTFGSKLDITLTTDDAAAPPAQVQISLWGNHAKAFPTVIGRQHPVIAFRNAIVTKKRRLCLFESGSFDLNPCVTQMAEVTSTLKQARV